MNILPELLYESERPGFQGAGTPDRPEVQGNSQRVSLMPRGKQRGPLYITFVTEHSARPTPTTRLNQKGHRRVFIHPRKFWLRSNGQGWPGRTPAPRVGCPWGYDGSLSLSHRMWLPMVKQRSSPEGLCLFRMESKEGCGTRLRPPGLIRDILYTSESHPNSLVNRRGRN